MRGPGDYEYAPATDDPNDPRNDVGGYDYPWDDDEYAEEGDEYEERKINENE
jgi:hypothetical protein